LAHLSNIYPGPVNNLAGFAYRDEMLLAAFTGDLRGQAEHGVRERSEPRVGSRLRVAEAVAVDAMRPVQELNRRSTIIHPTNFAQNHRILSDRNLQA
jgi:hypothetical protein